MANIAVENIPILGALVLHFRNYVLNCVNIIERDSHALLDIVESVSFPFKFGLEGELCQ